MGARTGAEYLEGLRSDGREVRLGGERVRDVTRHPAFAGSMHGRTGFYPPSSSVGRPAPLSRRAKAPP